MESFKFIEGMLWWTFDGENGDSNNGSNSHVDDVDNDNGYSTTEVSHSAAV